MEARRLLRLVKRARNGDRDAFSELVALKGRSIVYIATNLMGNSADGEDAAQEAIITLAQKIGTLKKAELFDAWLYRIVFNVCMDEKRKKASKIQSSTELDTVAAIVPEEKKELLPEASLQDAADKEEIMAAINDLPERYRLYLLLYYYEDMSYAEIAKTMEVSEQVVANTLNRAKEKMRESFVLNNPDKAGVTERHEVLFPGDAISSALADDEQKVVKPGAVAGILATTAALPLMKASLLTRFMDNLGAQVSAAAATVAVVALCVGFGASSITPAPEEPAPVPPAPVATEPAPEQPAPQQAVRSATVQGLPDGAKTTVLAEGTDDEALAVFEGAIDNYQNLTSVDQDGYRYTVYLNNNDDLDYVLTIKQL
ncbi:MAG: RNA polymerase sigma factor [Eggerthellaceae bacterium]|nr:RNA polymerase sigma factor [Eggerthellaceae bacterium]